MPRTMYIIYLHIYPTRVFSEFRGNYAEFRFAEFVEFRGISRNSVTFGKTKFRIILILQLQASTIGWGKGEMAQFKGTVLRDF